MYVYNDTSKGMRLKCTSKYNLRTYSTVLGEVDDGFVPDSHWHEKERD